MPPACLYDETLSKEHRATYAHQVDSNGTPTTARDAGRIHGLDALRGVLMMLGIVLHSSHGSFFEEGSELTTFIIQGNSHVIHLFRMPGFFLLSGFFCALLWAKRGPWQTMRNRVDRLVKPLFGMLWVLFPALVFVAAIVVYTLSGHPNISGMIWDIMTDEVYGNDDLLHLWFLYYLIIITLVYTTAVVWCERLALKWPRIQAWIKHTFERPWRCVFVFGGANALYWMSFGWTSIPTSTSWVPNLVILGYYILYFALGWTVYTSAVDLKTTQSRAWTLMGLAVVLVFTLPAFESSNKAFQGAEHPSADLILIFMLHALVTGLIIICFIRGLMGLFMRYASSGRFLWRYISDASYWVYLFHLPLTMSIPELLDAWHVPPMVKYAVTIALTFAICLSTYDLFIRSTWVGHVLNGRRYPRHAAKAGGLILIFSMGCGAVGLAAKTAQDKRVEQWYRTSGPLALIPFGYDPQLYGPKAPEVKARPLNRCVPLGRYTYCPNAFNRDDADAVCAVFNQTVLALKNKVEMQEIRAVIRHLPVMWFWLAASERKIEGLWTWDDQNRVKHFSWDTGQPDNHGGDEDCMIAWLNKEQNLVWHDARCAHDISIICEDRGAIP
ncbi:MAG: acyltransferase family protein [Myxococcota bacterium]|nr:acyltransferase family protein [Myxococcota bacterium]